MRRTDPQTIRQIIDTVLDSSARKSQFVQQKALSFWTDVVGPGVNKLTPRRYVSKGVLHVYVDSSPLKTELEFQKSALLAELNKRAGATDETAIKELRIH